MKNRSLAARARYRKTEKGRKYVCVMIKEQDEGSFDDGTVLYYDRIGGYTNLHM